MVESCQSVRLSDYFPKSIRHLVRIVALTGPGGGIYSSSSGTLSTAGCRKKIPQRVRSQPDPDKFFCYPKLFFMDLSLYGKYFALKSHYILVLLEG